VLFSVTVAGLRGRHFAWAAGILGLVAEERPSKQPSLLNSLMEVRGDATLFAWRPKR